jgi:hypothetical protein
MRRYYIVYDATTYDNGKNFVQIGVAEINRNAFIENIKYNHKSLYYKPEPKDNDASHIIAPW